MKRFFTGPAIAMLALGLAAGLLVGVGMLVGGLTVSQQQSQATSALDWPSPQVLRASASDSSDSFAMATGSIDSDAEGVFVMDFLTGDLQCFVINPRTSRFYAAFRRNLNTDLGVERGKATKFAMVTGQVNFRGSTGSVRPASTVCYVANTNNGTVGAYTVLWDSTAASAGRAQPRADIGILGTAQGRNLAVEQ